SVCLLDKSGCSGGVSVCGDGVVQSPNDAGFNEQCDTNDLDGKECTDFDDYVAGDLDCSGYCTFDYTECDVNIIPVCGNGNLEPGETCDPNKAGGIHGTPCQEYDSSRFLGGIVRCSSPDCEIDLSGCLAMVNFCGDGKVTAGEHCDDKLGVGDVDCSDLSDDFTSGSLECDNCSYDTDDCVGPTAGYCGDGVVSVGEQCDSGVEGRECPDISSYFIGGTLKCEDCEFDTDACIDKETDFCGDGKVTGYEACDGTNLAGLSCTNFSAFTGGILVCNDNCNLDSTGCTLGNTTTCNNNKTDGDETDLNCGGMVCPACQNGDRCKVNADCISNYCINNLCKEATCTDNVKNGLESDVDCGGDCPGCPVDKKCNIDYDCQEGLFCNDFSNLCALPSCDDGIMNGDETDVDCGGGCSEKCGNGLGCISPNDCKSGYCEAGICTMDKNKDEDNDNLPDWWEETHFGGIEYYDGDDDPDRDGHSNLDESIDGTDPNDPNDPLPDKKHTFQIIFLILGLLLMLGSAGFLVYSRKMLVPQQKIAAQPRAMPGQRPMPGQRLVPGQKPGPARLLPGGVRRPQPRPGLARRGGFAKRTAQKKAARKSLLKGFGTKADESKVKAKEAGALPKTPGKPVQGEKTAKPLEKKPSEEFIPLSRLGKGKKPGKPVPAKPGLGKGKSVPGAKPATGTAPEQAEAFEKLKELSESYKKKKGGKEKQIKQAKR
ncbi:hypothetical protein KY348_01870, partial [Candidatus Woesearchaeota archaeon]|nr:hypothetical protein [Candidatus Woesearchaeota archaeon]